MATFKDGLSAFLTLSWRITYDDGSTFSSDQGPWSDARVGGVLWVDVRNGTYHHRLQGHDYYWVHGDAFGVFNDPSNWDWYGGDQQFFKWRWVEGGSEAVVPAHVPREAHVLEGVTVPDEAAWDLGLLPRGEHLPPRPR
jgi:hypothetical protein